MKTTVTIEFDSPQAAAAFLAGQPSSGAAHVHAAPAPAPAPAHPAPAPAPAPAPGYSAPAPAPAPAPPTVSQAYFSAAVQDYAKAHSPKAAKAKLAEYGFGKVGDVPAERYAEMMQALAA